MAGKGSTWGEDGLMLVTRNGSRENVWWTYSYGSIDLDDSVGGVLVVCNDVTAQGACENAKRCTPLLTAE
ncbi:hypothetical protein [Mesorhizobium sp. INR15]|uniref:hypothetical protein n=1 Tax=Mesorhizobium sp. INR15 TaxID=2654248 RepID=UPI00215605CA|nr:hypothetical protein [Mesorhizobium sp. INR15]